MRDNKERRLIIDLKGIKKRFFEGTENEIGVLKGIDLQVYEGEFVSIVGASGSGKSTLMNIIGVLDRASEGSYLLDGADINQADDNELSHIRNKKIGFVFQTYNLIPASAHSRTWSGQCFTQRFREPSAQSGQRSF